MNIRISRIQYGSWRSCHCFVGHGKSCRYFTISWRNKIRTRQLVWRSIGWTVWQKWWHRWRCSVCVIDRTAVRWFLIHFHYRFSGISYVRQIMEFSFHWQKYHCHHCRVNHVYPELVPKNRSLQSEHWEALHRRLHRVCEWALRYRSPQLMNMEFIESTKDNESFLFEFWIYFGFHFSITCIRSYIFLIVFVLINDIYIFFEWFCIIKLTKHEFTEITNSFLAFVVCKTARINTEKYILAAGMRVNPHINVCS